MSCLASPALILTRSCSPSPSARTELTFDLDLWALRFVAQPAALALPVATADPAPLAPGDLLGSLFAEEPPPAPRPSGWQGAYQRRFKQRVEDLGALYAGVRFDYHQVTLAALRYYVEPEDRTPLYLKLPQAYVTEANKLRDKLTTARRTLVDAEHGFEALAAEARRLHENLLDMGWIVVSPLSFYRLRRTGVIVGDARELVDDACEGVRSLDNLPLEVARRLKGLVKLQAEHEQAIARVVALRADGPELQAELVSAARARALIEAMPAELRAEDNAPLSLSTRVISAAFGVIAQAVRRLEPGVERLRDWEEALITLDALIADLARLRNVTGQRRAELQRVRGAEVLGEEFPLRQRQAAELIRRRDQLALGELADLSEAVRRTVDLFTELQRRLEGATEASRQVLDAVPGLRGEIGKLQRLLSQGEAGSFPIVWTESRPLVAELNDQLAALVQLPPLTTLDRAFAELTFVQAARRQLAGLFTAVNETLDRREELRAQQLDDLFRHDASWLAAMRGLTQEIRRYGKANWPKGLLVRIDTEATGLARRVAGIPQPNQPVHEELIGPAAVSLNRLLTDMAAFDDRIEAIRQELRRLDTQALAASRQLEGVRPLLDRALSAEPTDQTLRGVLNRVVEVQRRLRPTIKDRLSDLVAQADVLERQSIGSCRGLWQRLRAEYGGLLDTYERLRSAIYEQASFERDNVLQPLLARASNLPALETRPQHEGAPGETVAEIEILAALRNEARSIVEQLGGFRAAALRSWDEVRREATQARRELQELSLDLVQWPPVALDLRKAEGRLTQGDRHAAQLMRCSYLRAYQDLAQRACKEYQACRYLLHEQRHIRDQQRQALIELEQWIEGWIEQRLARSANPSLPNSARNRAHKHLASVRDHLGRVRRRYGDPHSRANPQRLLQELQALIAAIQEEERRLSL